jgi:hypothetical protein
VGGAVTTKDLRLVRAAKRRRRKKRRVENETGSKPIDHEIYDSLSEKNGGIQ